jgi:hypothetical protein
VNWNAELLADVLFWPTLDDTNAESESGREPSRAFTMHRVPPLSAHIDSLVSNEHDNTTNPTATEHAQVITDNSISEHRLYDSAAIVHIISSSCSVSSWRSVSAAA